MSNSETNGIRTSGNQGSSANHCPSSKQWLLLRSGELGPGETEAMERHLSSCTACGDKWKSVEALLKAYDDTATPEIDDQLFNRMVRSASSRPQPGPGRHLYPGSRSQARWSALPLVLGAAAAVALVAVGITIGRGSVESSSEFVELKAEVRELRGVVLQRGLKSPVTHDRLAAATACARLEQPDDATILALIEALRTDPSPNVRLAVVDTLRQMPGASGHGSRLIATLETQKSEVILNAVIELLAAIQLHEAIPALENMAENGPEQEIRSRAQWALRQLL